MYAYIIFLFLLAIFTGSSFLWFLFIISVLYFIFRKKKNPVIVDNLSRTSKIVNNKLNSDNNNELYIENTEIFSTSFPKLIEPVIPIVFAKPDTSYPMPITKEEQNIGKGNPTNETTPDKSESVGFNFYMGAPDKNVFSNHSRFDVYKAGITLFEFTSFEFAQGGKNAEFKIISDNETVKLVRNNYLHVISPACESSVTPSIYTIEIKTERNGLAVLEGDNWKIALKSQIIYE